MEGEYLGDPALATWPEMGIFRGRKITKSEITNPGDKHHLREAQRGKREAHRACSEIVGLAEEEGSWMKKTKESGEGEKHSDKGNAEGI